MMTTQQAKTNVKLEHLTPQDVEALAALRRLPMGESFEAIGQFEVNLSLTQGNFTS